MLENQTYAINLKSYLYGENLQDKQPHTLRKPLLRF